MAFSADAIGFYLQAEDQLSPVLAKASSNYEKFTTAMEKSNQRIFASSSGALAKVASLVKSVEKTPQALSASYSKVLKNLASQAKSFTQPINLAFTAKDKKSLARELAGAVHKAISGARIRLGATFPSRKLGMFDTTFSLRTLYQQMAQPPDMRGTFEPKRFAKGGIVEGPKKGFDSVLSLLQPGEMVLPTDVSAQLQEMAGGALRGSGGQFLSSKEISESIANIENLSKALGQLKTAREAGLGTSSDAKAYAQGVEALSKEIDSLAKGTSNLSYQTRVRLAPAIKDATSRMEEFTEEGEASGTMYERLLGKIVGPARFLAISKAADEMANTFSELQSGVSDTFGELEGDQTESFVTNMNQVNRTLNLSRDVLREFKVEAGEVANAFDLNVNEMSEAIEGMTEAGLRNRKVMLALAPAVTQMAASSTADVNTLGQAAYQMTDAFEFSEGRVGVVFENVRRFTAQTATSADEAIQGMVERFGRMGPVLQRVTEQEGAQILTSMQALGAATADNWAGSVDTIPNILAEVLARSEEGLQSAALVFGSSADEIEARLKQGDLQGILDQVGAQIRSLTDTGNLTGLQALQEALNFEGTTQEFSKLGTATDDINSKLGELMKQSLAPEQTAEALDALGEAATNNRTAFEEFQTEVGQLTAKQLPGLGFSVAEVVDGIKEFGPTSILAIGMLGKMGLQAAMTTGKLLGVGKVFGKLGGLMSFGKGAKGATTALSGVGQAAGGLAGAAGSGGFMAGLASGMTALAGGIGTLGTVLLSPPGIAFTVTLIAALFSLAGAARLATPALKVWGDVMKTALGSAVDVLGLAVPVFQTFIETAGEVFLGTLDRMVLLFKELSTAEPGNLLKMGPALLSTAAGIGGLSAAILTLGAAFGTAAIGMGAFRLASGGSELGTGLAGALDTIVGDFGAMAAGPAMMENAKKQTLQAVGFVNSYGHLLNAIEALPGGGLLSGVFGDDPAEKLKEHATSIARAVRAMQVDFNGATSLQQRTSQAAFSPAQIETVISAVAEAGLNDDVRDEMLENNRLLRQILSALLERGVAGDDVAQVVKGPSRGASPLTRDIAGFNI